MEKEVIATMKSKMNKDIRMNTRRFLRSLPQYLGYGRLGLEQIVLQQVDSAIDKQGELISMYLTREETLPIRENSELRDMLLSELPEYQIINPCRERIIKELEGNFYISNIVNIWMIGLMELEGREYFSEEQILQILEFSNGVLGLVEKTYYQYELADLQLKTSLWEEWEKKLTRLYPDHVYKEFGAVVSLGDNFNQIKYPVISCSYVTNEHGYFYSLEQESQKRSCRRVGWYFHPSINDVVGMDPTDANIYVHNSMDEMEDFRAAMYNMVFIEDKKWLSGAYPSFQSCYPPIRMTEQKRFNEIVLSGNTEPDGVFFVSFGESGEKGLGHYEQAVLTAKERGIPLVIYDYYKKELRVELVQ